jgi:uncharacterized membrane protein YeaQ/YmgE (transglycosylase-associated protein family)
MGAAASTARTCRSSSSISGREPAASSRPCPDKAHALPGQHRGDSARPLEASRLSLTLTRPFTMPAILASCARLASGLAAIAPMSALSTSALRSSVGGGAASAAAIIIGGIAGWLAEQFMKSDMGLLMNIVLGIVGAAIASAILSFFGVALGGWIGYLIAGFIGACLLIWIVRAVRGRTA